MNTTTLTLEQAAKEAAGNWRHFDCFAWFDRPKDADNWTIIYTHHRDSGLMDQSNAAAIAKELAKYPKDAVSESHNHWAVGWVEGFSIRVFRGESITAAFRAYYELMQRLDDYPLLNETDYSEREYAATLDNIIDAAWRLKRQYTLTNDWQCDVYRWLADNRDNEIDNIDDSGGYPSESALIEAFEALRFERINHD